MFGAKFRRFDKWLPREEGRMGLGRSHTRSIILLIYWSELNRRKITFSHIVLFIFQRWIQYEYSQIKFSLVLLSSIFGCYCYCCCCCCCWWCCYYCCCCCYCYCYCCCYCRCCCFIAFYCCYCFASFCCCCVVVVAVALLIAYFQLSGSQPLTVPEAADLKSIEGARDLWDPVGVQPRLLGRRHQRGGRQGGLRQDHTDLLPILHTDASKRISGRISRRLSEGR